MAAITQYNPGLGFSGRLYGSFAGKTPTIAAFSLTRTIGLRIDQGPTTLRLPIHQTTVLRLKVDRTGETI